MGRNHRCAWLVAGAIAVAGCSTEGGKFARDMGMAAGEGALSGFSDYVTYQDENKWGSAWNPSGRGVEGVASRAANPPDCGAVSDESQLYVGDLLKSPGSYVSTIDGEIDAAAWKTLHTAGLKLAGAHQGGAIGILHTTAGRYARFVLQWKDQPQLQDLTVYNQDTGEVVLRFEVPMPLAPHALVNLDQGETEGFDLLFGPDPDGRPTLAAGDGAELSFPIASLCKIGKRGTW
jgi:hypothetical protein